MAALSNQIWCLLSRKPLLPSQPRRKPQSLLLRKLPSLLLRKLPKKAAKNGKLRQTFGLGKVLFHFDSQKKGCTMYSPSYFCLIKHGGCTWPYVGSAYKFGTNAGSPEPV